MTKRILSLVIAQLMVIGMMVNCFNAVATESYQSNLVWPLDTPEVAAQTSIDGMDIGAWTITDRSAWKDKTVRNLTGLSEDSNRVAEIVSTNTEAYHNLPGKALRLTMSDQNAQNKSLLIFADMQKSLIDNNNFSVKMKVLPKTSGFQFDIRDSGSNSIPLFRFNPNGKIVYSVNGVHGQYNTELCSFSENQWYDITVEFFPVTPLPIDALMNAASPHTSGSTYRVTVSDGTNEYSSGIQQAKINANKYAIIDGTNKGFKTLNLSLTTAVGTTQIRKLETLIKDVYVYEKPLEANASLKANADDNAAIAFDTNTNTDVLTGKSMIAISASNPFYESDVLSQANYTITKNGQSVSAQNISVSDDKKTVYIKLADSLDFGAEYKIMFGDLITDIYGQKLNDIALFKSGLTVNTAEGGALIVVSPIETTNIPVNTSALNFSVSTAFESAIAENALNYSVVPAVDFTPSFVNGNIVISFNENLQYNTTYTVTFNDGLVDQSNQKFNEQCSSFSFTTENYPALTAAVTPSNNATVILKNNKITITPSNAMDTATVTAANITAQANGVATPIKVSMPESDIIVEFKEFEYDTTYTLNINDSVKDIFGQKLNLAEGLAAYSIKTEVDPRDLPPLFSENFDTADLGAWSGEKQVGGGQWPNFRLNAADTGNQTDLQVVNNSILDIAPYKTGKSFAMSLTGKSPVSSMFSYSRFAAPVSSGEVFIKAKINADTLNAGFFIETRNSLSKSTNLFMMGANGSVQYAGEVSGYYNATPISGFSYQPKKWYDIEIVIRPDPIDSRYDLNIYDSATGEKLTSVKDKAYIGGNDKTTNTPINAVDVSMIYFGVVGLTTNASTVYVDEIAASRYEPTSCVWEFSSDGTEDNKFTGSSVTASVKLNGKNETASKSAVIVIASYNGDGKLIATKTSAPLNVVAENNTVVSDELTMEDITADVQTVKMFLWDGLGNISPATEAITLTRA